MKKLIIGIIIGGIIFGSIGVLAGTYLYNAKDVSYNDTNVESAINTLYENVNSELDLNFTTPLFKFTANNQSYTVTKDCYLYGAFYTGTNSYPYVMINNKSIGLRNNYYTNIPYPLRLSKDDVVSVSNVGTFDASSSTLAIYEANSKSNSPKLDYSSPLFEFTANNQSYTVTDDCYLYGEIHSDYNISPTFTLNNNYIGWGDNYHNNVAYPIKLKKDDVVTISNNRNVLSSNTNLAIYPVKK